MWRHIEPYSDIFRTLCNPCIYNRLIFRTLAPLRHLKKPVQHCKMIKHIQSPGIVRTIYSSNFQGYLGIFRDTGAYLATLTSAQIVGRRELPCPFLKIEKSVHLWCVHFWVKFSIQEVVLRVSRRKKLQNVSLRRPFFSCVFDEMFIEMF